MYETTDDVVALQEILDRSYAAAGTHLSAIHTPDRRLNARQLAATLHGMQVLNLATVTRDGRPLVSPVDGIFYRGRFLFGSSHDSVRFRHLRARPHVSASHTRGEELAVVVHGRAEMVAIRERPDLVDVMVEIYGDQWHDWGHMDAAYAFIDPDRMYTFTHRPQDYPEA